MHDDNNHRVNDESARRIIVILGIDDLEKRYREYVDLKKKLGFLLAIFYAFLFFVLIYYMQYALQIRMHLPKILGDWMPYFIIIVLIPILPAGMFLTSKNEKLSDDWSLRSYYFENLTFGAGLIIFVAAGFITEGIALAGLTHQNTGMIYAYFIIGMLSIVGFAMICMHLRGKFFITKRFTVEMDGKDLANHLSSFGLDCKYLRYSGIKCGEMKISIVHSMDSWKNRNYWKITIRTISENNAIVAKRIIEKIEEFAKSEIR